MGQEPRSRQQSTSEARKPFWADELTAGAGAVLGMLKQKLPTEVAEWAHVVALAEVLNRQGVRNWQGLLLQVARRRGIDELRRRGEEPLTGQLELEPMDTQMGPDELAEQAEQLVQAMRLLEQLPPKQQAVFWMREVEGLTYEEVAAVMNTEVCSVRKTLSLARKRVEALRAQQQR